MEVQLLVCLWLWTAAFCSIFSICRFMWCIVSDIYMKGAGSIFKSLKTCLPWYVFPQIIDIHITRFCNLKIFLLYELEMGIVNFPTEIKMISATYVWDCVTLPSLSKKNYLHRIVPFIIGSCLSRNSQVNGVHIEWRCGLKMSLKDYNVLIKQ
jgi:hypothetical protein